MGWPSLHFGKKKKIFLLMISGEVIPIFKNNFGICEKREIYSECERGGGRERKRGRRRE
jgi:hypothetical protein